MRHVVLLLLLVGCGPGSYYPVFAPGSVDTGPSPSGPGPEPDVPCGEDGPIGRLEVGLHPEHPDVVALFEVQPATCEEVQVTALAPGESWSGTVVTGHTWVVRRSSDLAFVDWFVVPLGDGVDGVEVVP